MAQTSAGEGAAYAVGGSGTEAAPTANKGFVCSVTRDASQAVWIKPAAGRGLALEECRIFSSRFWKTPMGIVSFEKRPGADAANIRPGLPKPG